MKKSLKIILCVLGLVVFLTIIDLISIFSFSKPIFATKGENENFYKGVFYDVYNCPEFSVAQIKTKGTKFSCSVKESLIGNTIEINDVLIDIKDFMVS